MANNFIGQMFPQTELPYTEPQAELHPSEDITLSGYPINCCYPLTCLHGLTSPSTRVSRQLVHQPMSADPSAHPSTFQPAYPSTAIILTPACTGLHIHQPVNCLLYIHMYALLLTHQPASPVNSSVIYVN